MIEQFDVMIFWSFSTHLVFCADFISELFGIQKHTEYVYFLIIELNFCHFGDFFNLFSKFCFTQIFLLSEIFVFPLI